MIVITSLGILSLAFLQGGLQHDKEAGARADEARANLLLEAAFTESLAALAAGYVGGVGTIDNPAVFGDGLFWVDATDQEDGHTHLYATAMVGSARMSQELVAKVEPTTTNFVIEGVVSQGDVALWPNVSIDSYDPDLGDYDSQPVLTDGNHDYVSNNGSIITNGTLSLKPNATVHGDVTVGPGEGLTSIKGDVAGDTTVADDPVTFGMPTLPNLPSAGDLTATGMALTAGVYRFDDVAIEKISIQGPATIICDSLDIRNTGKININSTGGPVNFMVLGDFSSVPQEEFHVDRPSDIRFFLYDSLNLKFDGKMYGLFYAPDSDFMLESKTELFGAIVCDELQAMPNCKFHFDESFMKDDITVVGLPNVSRAYWGEAELPARVQHAHRGNPFAALGVDEKDLAHASGSWDMTYRPIDDQYVNDSVYDLK